MTDLTTMSEAESSPQLIGHKGCNHRGNSGMIAAIGP